MIRLVKYYITILFISLLGISTYAQDQLWKQYDDILEALPNQSIQCLAVDQQQQIWIGTEKNGLALFNDDGIYFYNKNNSGLTDNAINAIYIDKNNNKWIGTETKGLFFFDNNNWINYNTDNSGIAANTIMDVFCDTNCIVWVGTYFNGISKLDKKIWSTYNASNSNLLSNKITSVTIDKNDKLWIGTMGAGIYSFDGTSWDIFTEQNSSLPNNFIYDIAVDALNNKWIGTAGGGIGVYNDQFWVIFNTDNSGLSSNHIRSILITEKGNKWISTYRLGLDNFNGENWQHFNSSNSGLPNDEILCFEYLESDELIIGTRQSGIVSYLDTVKAVHQGYKETFTRVGSNSIIFSGNNNIITSEAEVNNETEVKTTQTLSIVSGPVSDPPSEELEISNFKSAKDNWFIGFHFGSSIFKGDMDVTNPTSLLGLYSFSLGKQLHEIKYANLFVNTDINIGMLKGGKKGMSFRNDFKEIRLNLKADLGKNINPDSKWSMLKPFIYTGVGLLNFRSMLWDLDGAVVNGYGYKVTSDSNIHFDEPEKTNSKYQFIIPIGLGTGIHINQHFDWCFIFSSSYHTSDILDAKEARKNDKYLFFTTGFNYKF